MKFDRNLVGRCSDPAGSDNRIPTDKNPAISVRGPNESYRNPIVRSDRITTPSDEVPVESESDDWERSPWVIGLAVLDFVSFFENMTYASKDILMSDINVSTKYRNTFNRYI
jgi:hypothetical protein